MRFICEPEILNEFVDFFCGKRDAMRIESHLMVYRRRNIIPQAQESGHNGRNPSIVTEPYLNFGLSCGDDGNRDRSNESDKRINSGCFHGIIGTEAVSDGDTVIFAFEPGST